MTPLGDPRLPDRFWSKVAMDEVTGCWLWQRNIIPRGYGQFWFAGRTRMAHRVAYTQLVGPIGDGFHIDHLCHSTALDCLGGFGCVHRACVNPAHLEQVLPIQNSRRSVQSFARRVYCLSGRHLLTARNTIVRPNGRHRCRDCYDLARNKRQPIARARARAIAQGLGGGT